MKLTIDKIFKSDLQSLSIKIGQFIYCTDTKECYYDTDESHRIQIGNSIQLNSESDRKNISIALKDKIYIVVDTNKLYRYKKDWIEINDTNELTDMLVAAHELIPTTISKGGVRYAPKTYSSCVYFNDGRTLDEAMQSITEKNQKAVILTRTEFVVASHDNQKIFNIPFPISNYDLESFPIVVIGHGKNFSTNEYTLSRTQVIFKNEVFNKDEIVTFIFNYSVSLTQNIINASSINGNRYFVGTYEPLDKKEGDVWINTASKEMVQYTNGRWKSIISTKLPEGSIDESKLSVGLKDKIDNMAEAISKQQIIRKKVILNNNSNAVTIPDDTFNKETDQLFLFRNSIYIEQGDTSDGYTINDNGTQVCNLSEDLWMGAEEPITFNFIILKGSKIH